MVESLMGKNNMEFSLVLTTVIVRPRARIAPLVKDEIGRGGLIYTTLFEPFIGDQHFFKRPRTNWRRLLRY